MDADQKPINDLPRETLEKSYKKNLRELHEWHREAKKLKKQNQKLREALEEIINSSNQKSDYTAVLNRLHKIAQQALDEVNNNE